MNGGWWGLEAMHVQIALHLGAALAAGGLIGLERGYHGRPAGFRTHTLVSLASAALMTVTLYQGQWFAATGAARTAVDPTRMAQGIMTGIGFLGAGVIFKEGLSVRGLTTAASIWMTASIGVLMGVGLFMAGWLSTVLTLGVLVGFRSIEQRMPTHLFAHHVVRFDRHRALSEPALRALLAREGFVVTNLSWRLDGETLEYRMVLRTLHAENLAQLARALAATPEVSGFRLAPAGD